MGSTVVLDWDGTLVPSMWPEMPGSMFPGAAMTLATLHSEGYEFVVNSCRVSPRNPYDYLERDPGEVKREYEYIRDTLDNHGLSFVTIHDNVGKPGANLYVDDKALHFPGKKAWETIMYRRIKERTGERPEYSPR